MISKLILNKLLGWKENGYFPHIAKSVVIVAPHTSYWDAIIGKLYLMSLGVRHKFLSKKELFYFPANIVMRLFGSIPVGGVKGHNAIIDVCKIINSESNIHIVLCPEGAFARTEKWNPGFYYMAQKAGVPIVVGYLDYQKKEIGIKGVITDLSDIHVVYQEISEYYKDVSAKYPQNFALPKDNHK